MALSIKFVDLTQMLAIRLHLRTIRDYRSEFQRPAFGYPDEHFAGSFNEASEIDLLSRHRDHMPGRIRFRQAKEAG